MKSCTPGGKTLSLFKEFNELDAHCLSRSHVGPMPHQHFIINPRIGPFSYHVFVFKLFVLLGKSHEVLEDNPLFVDYIVQCLRGSKTIAQNVGV